MPYEMVCGVCDKPWKDDVHELCSPSITVKRPAHALTHDHIAGVGPDAPLVVNEHGVKQSDTPYRADLLDPRSLLRLAAICKQGAVTHGEDNWRGLSVRENLNHAMVHILAHLAGDDQDDHLGHAFCRLMFACGVDAQGGPRVA